MLEAVDGLLIVFHTVLILFILAGWAWKPARRAHLVVTLLTVLSWFVLGAWYGFGYCPLTDWHWQVRARLGHTNLPASYLKFLLDTLTGWNVNAVAVDVSAVAGLLAVTIASTALNARDLIRARRREPRD